MMDLETMTDSKLTDQQIDAIPEQMRSLPQWIAWRYEDRKGKGSKVPYQLCGQRASTTNPQHWSTFNEALDTYNGSDEFSGIGFVFTEEDGIFGLDLDNCYQGGKLADWAGRILERFDSYTELSPSLRGLKVYCLGDRVFKGRRVDVGGHECEVYSHGRYFAVTGRVFREPGYLADCSKPLEWLLEQSQPELKGGDCQSSCVSSVPYADRLRRAEAYAAATPGAISGQRGHDDTFSLACRLARGFDLKRSDAARILHQWNDRCEPPWSTRELEHKLDSAYDTPDAPGYMLGSSNIVEKAPSVLSVTRVANFISNPPPLHEPLVDGLLRRGETMNIIGAPKTGKSWLLMDLIFSVASGQSFLGGIEVLQGRVLLLDNELHKSTLLDRALKVALARNLVHDDWCDNFDVECLRGKLRPLDQMYDYFAEIGRDRYDLICLDAGYRFWPRGMSENDNADATQVYNLLDLYAYKTGCSIVVVHHTSKGNQSAKSVTDVGSGAGAMSRAADTHLTLREHAEKGHVVLDAVTRSFPPVKTMTLKSEFPRWVLSDRAPELKQEPTASEKKTRHSDLEELDYLIAWLRNEGEATRRQIRDRGGWGLDKANRVIRLGIDSGTLEECEFTKRGKTQDGIRLAVQSGGTTGGTCR
jgi:hypothetical protein